MWKTRVTTLNPERGVWHHLNIWQVHEQLIENVGRRHAAMVVMAVAPHRISRKRRVEHRSGKNVDAFSAWAACRHGAVQAIIRRPLRRKESRLSSCKWQVSAQGQGWSIHVLGAGVDTTE